MHILHIVQLYHPVATGAARYFAEIGQRLAGEGHSVTVLATDAYDLEHFWAPGKRTVGPAQEQHHGVQIVRLPVQRIPGPPIVYPVIRRLMVELGRVPGSGPLLRRMAMLTPKLPDMSRFLERQAPPFDIVHAANITLDFAILPAVAYARRRGIPFICTPFVHLGAPGDQAIVRYYSMRHQIELLRDSDQVLTMTNLERDFLARRGVPPEKIRSVGVGVDPAEVLGGDAARFRAEHGIQGPVVLYIGALAFDKGAVHTVEAMQRLWAQGSDATLALIGAPLAHFTAFYERLPPEHRRRTVLLPYAPHDTKRDALAAASLLSMPSRTDSFGISFLEAWCYGLPVVGARAGGVPDVIADGHDGLLVPFGDVAALADTIGGLLADPERAAQLGQAGRAKVARELTWDNVYERVRPAYGLDKREVV